jgi:uncharacterized membrane protein YdbT with pleckstrin-like domain
MPFPSRLLAEDEEVILDLHAHWKALVLPILVVPIVVGAATYGILALPDNSGRAIERWVLVGAAFLLLVRFSLWPFLKWQTTRYVLTTRRVVIRSGVFGRTGRDIPLVRVNDVSFRHNLFERMLRCGTLTIESAGEHGQEVLRDVPRVEHVQREIYRAVEAEGRRHTSAGSGPDH